MSDSPGDPHEGHEGRVTLTLLAASTLTVMAGATIAPGLTGMSDHFADVSGAEFLSKIVLTTPALGIALFGSMIGWLVDRRGRRDVLAWAIVLYAIAGTSGLYLNSLYSIIVGRLVLGVAVAGTMTAATTLVGDYFRGAERNRVIGLQAAAMSLGGVVFVSLGGALAEWHWRAPFLVYATSLLLIPPVVVFIREPEPVRIDVSGGDHADYRGVPRLLAFLYAVILLMQIAFFMVPVQLPFYLEKVGGTSPSRVGVAIALMTVCSGSVAAAFKWIRSRFDPLPILGVSFGLMGIGYVIMSAADGFAGVVVAIMVFGLGLGLMFPNIVGWLMASTPHKIRGRVVGGLTTFAFSGQFLSPIVLLPLIEWVGIDGAFRLAGLAMIAGAAAALATSTVGAKRGSRDA